MKIGRSDPWFGMFGVTVFVCFKYPSSAEARNGVTHSETALSPSPNSSFQSVKLIARFLSLVPHFSHMSRIALESHKLGRVTVVTLS